MNGGKTYEDFNKIPPNDQAIYDMVKATVEWFGEDVDYYGIFHEANHPKYWDGSWEDLMNLFIIPAKIWITKTKLVIKKSFQLQDYHPQEIVKSGTMYNWNLQSL